MKKIIAIILLSLLSFVSFANSSLEKEESSYIAAFNSGSYEKIKSVLGDLQWKGINNEAVYDALLKQFHKFKVDVSKYGVKQTGHIARGLATSGNEKYQVILQQEIKETRSKHLRKYYKRAIGEFDRYARINPIISKGLKNAKNVNIQRVINMLAADDTEIVVIGAKRVYHAYTSNDELLKITKKRLLELYPIAKDKNSVQAAAYLAKALAKSDVGKYGELLRKIAKEAPSKKLRKYAKKYLRSM